VALPELGLVISYAYLWRYEHDAGREEGRKDRPCAIVMALERAEDDVTVVTVLPITQVPPSDPDAAVEIPLRVKQALGLDEQRSWIVVNEGNQFPWPGFDLRKNPATGEFHYGFLPPRFFSEVLARFLKWYNDGSALLTER
jgi:hypothetical protein